MEIQNTLNPNIIQIDTILQTYDKKVPVIIETDLKLSKKKYIIPKDMTVSQFHSLIRKRIDLSSKESLLIFINNVLPIQSDTFDNLYNLHKNDDKCLYIIIKVENTFG